MPKSSVKKKKTVERKELFTILGTFKDVENPKTGYTETRFVPNSTGHFRTMSANSPKGKVIAATFYENITARSRNQVAYHYVLLRYIAKETGYTVDELHDAIMRIVFGTKVITINGKAVEIRKSLSHQANLPKYEAVELIEYDLDLCEQLHIKVPTPEELGYITESTVRYGKGKKATTTEEDDQGD